MTPAQRGRIRAELHDRFTAPLYAFAFGLIGFAALGVARTTRQGRGLAMGLAVIAVVGLRILGFALSSLTIRFTWVVPLAYLTPLLAIGVSILIGFGGTSMFARRTLMRKNAHTAGAGQA